MKNGSPARRKSRSYCSTVGIAGPILLTVPVVSWHPSAGMVCASWVVDGDELLGQRGGLARYEATRSTMGIPLLHPWANRINGWNYAAAGRRVELDPDSPIIKTDPNGVPIHGFLGASPYWDILGATADDTMARLSARLDFADHPEYLEGFPFPHTLELDVTLRETTITIRSTITAGAETPVPISYGFHPYFTIPDAPREEWHVELPPMKHLLVDEGLIPTGELEPFSADPGPLGDTTYDDIYTDLPESPRFVLAGGDHRITVDFLAGYRYAVVFAPEDDDVVCFEPMTAPTNALQSGDGLETVPPGESRSASFSITVGSQ